MSPEVIQIHSAAVRAELFGFKHLAKVLRKILADRYRPLLGVCLVLLAVTLSGCASLVTELPQTASDGVYQDYNRARFGNPTVATPARK